MRRSFVLGIVALLGLAPLSIGQISTSAQEGQDVPTGDFAVNWNSDTHWEGVSRPEIVQQTAPERGDIPPVIETLPQFEVYFAVEFAAVPVIYDAEFMIVVVQEGSFALDLTPGEATPAGDQSFLVHPGDGGPIPTMIPSDPPDMEPYYELSGDFVLGADDQPCTSMCVIPSKTIVEVKPGDNVRVECGALKGLCGIFDRRTRSSTRVLMLLQAVSYQASVEVEGLQVRKVS